MDFRKELAALINKHSLENESNTPDFILADYLDKCLYAFDSATRDRTKWYKPDTKHFWGPTRPQRDYSYYGGYDSEGNPL